MTLASIGGWSIPVSDWIYYPLVTVVFLTATYFIARLLAGFVADRVRKRRGELTVITRRVVTALVIVVGVFLALGWAAQNANVTLFGLLVATVVVPEETPAQPEIIGRKEKEAEEPAEEEKKEKK